MLERRTSWFDAALTVEEVAQRLENAHPRDVLHWALSRFRGRIALACSFGGPTGIAALDIAMQIDRRLPVYYLDTGLLFPQTLELVETVSQRYGIAPLAVRPSLSLAQQARRYGDDLWERDPDACCTARKVDPQRTFLAPYDAWISGIRRDQSPSRRGARVVERDRVFGRVKVNPFATWSEERLWEYVRSRRLPYNELHEHGYPSLGCVPCTQPARGGATRSGRWSRFAKTECGLHAAPARSAP